MFDYYYSDVTEGTFHKHSKFVSLVVKRMKRDALSSTQVCRSRQLIYTLLGINSCRYKQEDPEFSSHAL